jgi:hypothetical protein
MKIYNDNGEFLVDTITLSHSEYFLNGNKDLCQCSKGYYLIVNSDTRFIEFFSPDNKKISSYSISPIANLIYRDIKKDLIRKERYSWFFKIKNFIIKDKKCVKK